MISRLRSWWHGASWNVAARTAALAAWDVKVMGSALAARLYEEGRAGPAAPVPPAPATVGLGGRLCRQEDIEAEWLRFWCGELKFAPLYHRKVWEDCYALQLLYEHGMLAEGRRGLGFAVGAEWLPSFLAAAGVDVLATDLATTDPRAQPWMDTGQHGGSETALFKPELVAEDLFRRHVTMRAVDMNRIPDNIGRFDFLWSICSLEHCGTLAKGMDFVVAAMRCLRPGGIAVHTTEFNVNPDGPTPGRGRTVLYQRRHMEALAARLDAAGHTMLPMDFGTGDGVLDRFVDLPPYEAHPWFLPSVRAPHLRASHQGHAVTSIGFAVKAGR